MHSLLKRQLRRATNSTSGEVSQQELLEMVSAAYDDADRQRCLKDRTVSVLGEELEELSQRIRQEADALFSTVMDNVGEAVVLINCLGLIESFNKAAERIFGYGANEVIGQNVNLLMTHTDKVHHDHTLGKFLRTGEARIIGVGRETVARRSNGEEFPIELAIGEIVSGGRQRFVGIIRDITLRKRTEQELRESETRFRDLTFSASDWFWETDDSGCLTYVSERIATVLGVKPSAILGHTFLEIGLADSSLESQRHLTDIAARRAFRDRVFHVGPASGKDCRTVRISGAPIYDADRIFVGYRGVGVDISREIDAETRARAAQQRLADAIENLADALVVFDSNDCLVACNEAYRRIFRDFDGVITQGATFESILRAAEKANIFNTEQHGFDHWVQERLKRHREATGEAFDIRMGDGRWILSRETRTQDGGVVGVRTDITELKQREQDVENLRRRYAQILDSAGEGIVGLDSQGHITFANRMAATMLGYRPDEMIGSWFRDLIQPNEMQEKCAIDDSAISLTYREGRQVQVDDELFQLKNGQRLPVEYQVAPIWENGTVGGAVLVFRDITLRKHYEQALADHQRELEKQVDVRTVPIRLTQTPTTYWVGADPHRDRSIDRT